MWFPCGNKDGKELYDILVRDSPVIMPHFISIVNSGLIVL